MRATLTSVRSNLVSDGKTDDPCYLRTPSLRSDLLRERDVAGSDKSMPSSACRVYVED